MSSLPVPYLLFLALTNWPLQLRFGSLLARLTAFFLALGIVTPPFQFFGYGSPFVPLTFLLSAFPAILDFLAEVAFLKRKINFILLMQSC